MYFFPTPFPDELWYSVMARYHQNSGNTALVQSLKDIFGCRTHLPAVEMPSYINDILERLPQNYINAEEIVLNHSVFPYYSRFFHAERKMDIYQRCCTASFTPQAQGQALQYLKFCPICREEQEKQYGESFWLRQHQMKEMLVCSKHNVDLQNSPYLKGTGRKVELHTLDKVEKANQTQNENPLLLTISKAMEDCLRYPLEFKNVDSIECIKLALVERGYLSLSGQITLHKKLIQDFRVFYGNDLLRQFDLAISDDYRNSLWLSNLLYTQEITTIRVVLLAVFLRIEMEDLCSFNAKATISAIWDDELRHLAAEKKSLRDIAKRLSSNTKTIKRACERLGISPYWKCNGGGQYKACGGYENSPEFQVKRENLRAWWLQLQVDHPDCTHTALRRLEKDEQKYKWLHKNDYDWLWENSPQKPTPAPKRLDYVKLDADNLDKVKACIGEMQAGRPQRVTLHSIATKCQIPIKRLKNMLGCMEYISQYVETLEEFQQRKVVWAIGYLKAEGRNLTKTNILSAAGVKPKYLSKMGISIECPIF